MDNGNGTFDLDFRPKSYWVFANARQQLRAGQTRVDDGELLDLLDDVVSDEEQSGGMSVSAELDMLTAFLGRLNHPAREGGAVEIAHIQMFNPWCDYISVLAEWRDGRIHYEVVDPYPYYWTYRCTPESSERPLSLGELIELIDTAELVGNSSGEAESRGLVFGVLEQNLDGAVDNELRSFIRVSSAFYDDLEVWYALACSEWCREHSWEEEEEEEEDDLDPNTVSTTGGN